MPDVSGMAQPPEPMLLMAGGFDLSVRLQASDLAQLIRQIYIARYGLKSDDPLVTTALASIAW